MFIMTGDYVILEDNNKLSNLTRFAEHWSCHSNGYYHSIRLLLKVPLKHQHLEYADPQQAAVQLAQVAQQQLQSSSTKAAALQRRRAKPIMLKFSRSKHLCNAPVGTNSNSSINNDFTIQVHGITLQQFISGISKIQNKEGPYSTKRGTIEASITTIAASLSDTLEQEAEIRKELLSLLSLNSNSTIDEPACIEYLQKQFETSDSNARIYEMDYNQKTGRLPFFKFANYSWDYGFIIVDKSGHNIKLGMASNSD